jgi:hypothetical protein
LHAFFICPMRGTHVKIIQIKAIYGCVDWLCTVYWEKWQCAVWVPIVRPILICSISDDMAAFSMKYSSWWSPVFGCLISLSLGER